MKLNRLGQSTIVFKNKPKIQSYYSLVGKKEGEGPFKKYFDAYQLRRWRSFRYGGFFLNPKDFDNQALFSWLGSYYHAVSIEKVHNLSCFRKLTTSNFFIKFCRPKCWEFISFFIRIYRRLFNLVNYKY